VPRSLASATAPRRPHEGKVTVRVAISAGGVVESVSFEGPAAFRVLEPCIRTVILGLMFPRCSEAYGTEFSYLFRLRES